MPQNVRDAFTEDVFTKVGGLSPEDAEELLHKMERTGRLQVETW